MSDAQSRRVTTLIVSFALAVGLAIAAVVIRVPYVEISPGITCDTLTSCRGEQVIVIDPTVKQYPPSGALRLTTVQAAGAPGTRRLSLLDALRGWVNGKVAVYPRDVLYAPGTSGEVEDCQSAVDQRASQNSATVAALRYLNYKVPVTTEVYAREVGSKTPASASKIATCDVILSVDGVEPKDRDDLIRIIHTHKPGDTVTVVFTHDGNKVTRRIRLIGSPSNSSVAFLGLTPDNLELSHPPFRVKINLQDVGGPSAGLMFALGIIDILTPGDLTGGQNIAGTGTIDDKGNVGPIGGVQQKVFAAKRDGATVFIMPADDCKEAKRVHVKGIRLLSVDKLTDALSTLAALRGEPGNTVKAC